ncbi:MAG: hypothetical protein HOP17_06605 [Acidobacteria bacterium]|nr:hypothetical protein [Acidobacteriota bacterium]
MKPKILSLCFLIALLSRAPALFAFETDQYNLPPEPLADIGEEVAEYVEDNLHKAIEKINIEIARLQECRESKRSDCDTPSRSKRLAHLRSEDAVARAVFELLGDGTIPFTRSGTWMNSHKFRAQPARFKTGYRQSIFVYLPSDYFTISPTVKMYGHSFGTDKIAHFFQQGYTYYRIHKKSVAEGMTDAEAVKKSVSWGKMTESTYYGTFVGGVFSNADLYANYAGMLFYQGLVKSIAIGNVTRRPTLVLKNGVWVMNEPAGRLDLLAPFISDHLNEALNPSLYLPGLRSSIRGIVRKRSCQGWKAAYPDRTQQDFERLTASLIDWNGIEYGHKKSSKFITIANTCF